MSAKRFKHDENCPCFGDWVEHSKDCKNCECQPAPSEGGKVSDTKRWDCICGSMGIGDDEYKMHAACSGKGPHQRLAAQPAEQTWPTSLDPADDTPLIITGERGKRPAPAEVSERLKEWDSLQVISDQIAHDIGADSDVATQIEVALAEKLPDHATLLAELAALREALVAAKEHLEYCGYGDKWERECAEESNLAEKIEAALSASGGGTKETTCKQPETHIAPCPSEQCNVFCRCPCHW